MGTKREVDARPAAPPVAKRERWEAIYEALRELRGSQLPGFYGSRLSKLVNFTREIDARMR
jgi:hypothetical protein